MKSLMSLWSCTARELAVRCCTSATLDIKTVERRVEHEGLSFLAITLADLGKATQKWLDLGHVDSSECSAFALQRKSGSPTSFPAFLSGFYSRVFDSCSGVLLNDPDIEAIYAIRQLTLMFSKIALPEDTRKGIPQQLRRHVSVARERRAMSEFVQCEQDVRESDAQLSDREMRSFCAVSDLLFASVFSRVDREVYDGELLPKHGPGATAERLSSNGKYVMQSWTARLDEAFPVGDYLLPNYRFYDGLDRVNILEPGAEIPVRVITVPKTLKSPRIIAIEPAAVQYCQQAVLRALLDSINRDRLLSRMLGFSDQEPNRFMACQGSLRNDLATLDLSEASDRVSNQLVRAMLRNHPHLLRAVQAARSRKADVPGHGVVRLAKFASMGSSLCFPFEAMVFLTLIFMGVEQEASTSLCRRDVKRLVRQVRVFGDDIVVPKRHVLSVVQKLTHFGAKVNLSKSFWTGRFRESCGREYYAGQDVSIVKVRQVLPTQRQNASGVIAAVALRNQLYRAGLWQSCRWLDEYIEGLIKFFPTVLPTSPLLGRDSFLGYTYQKLDPYTHGPLSKGYFVRAESPSDPLEGPGALLKCLLKSESRSRDALVLERGEGTLQHIGSPPGDEEHLERTGRPKHVSIKLGWRSST